MKKAFRYTFFILALLMVAHVSMGQKVRYVQTGYIDKYGSRQSANASQASMVINIEYYGNYAIYCMPQLTVTYRYHHRDGYNSVYYRVNKNPKTGNEMWVENSVLIVSPDKMLINSIDYFQGQRIYTLIYEQKEADSYGTMAR